MKLFQLLASTLCATSLVIANITPLKFDILRGADMSSAEKKPRLLKRDGGIVYSDTLYEGQYYYAANITIAGTEFLVQLDTGSSDLWVYGSDNPFCSSNHGVMVDQLGQSSTIDDPARATLDCETYGTFDINHEDFETEGKLLYASYGGSNVAMGYYGRSTVSFGNATIEGFMFGVANASNSTLPICGLGFEANEFSSQPFMTTSSPGGEFMYQNLPSAMKQTGLIKRTAFSLWMDGESSEGYILFGAIDHSKYSGELVTLPLLVTDNTSQPNAYQVGLNAIKLSDGDDEVEVLVNATSVLFDSGTSDANLSEDLIEIIAEALDAKYSDSQGTYVLDCPKESTNTSFTFSFDGIDIEVPLENFLLATDHSGKKCGLQIHPGSTNILGDIFLQNVYVVFDQDGLQLRVAPVDNNNDSADIEILDAAKTPSGGYKNETLTATASWDGTLTTTEGQAITHSLKGYISSDYGLSTSESATASKTHSKTSSKNLCGKVYSTFTISGLISFILMMAL